MTSAAAAPVLPGLAPSSMASAPLPASPAAAVSAAPAVPAVAPAASPAVAAAAPAASVAAPAAVAPASAGAMDQFVQPYEPGSAAAAHLFVTTHIPAASRAGRTRKSVVPSRPVVDTTTEDGQQPKAKRCRGPNGISSSSLKNVSVSQRLVEFPDNSFVESAGKLFCQACPVRLSTRKSTIMSHCKGANHVKRMALWTSNREETPARIARFSEFCKTNDTQYGKNLLPEVNDRRFKILTSLMEAGVPMSKLDALRPMFAQLGVDCCGSKKSKEYIDFIRDEELRNVRSTIKGKNISISCDATPFNGTETFGVVARVVGEDLAVKKLLVSLRMLQSAMTNKHIASEVMDVITKRLGIDDRGRVLAFMYDGCSANRKAFSETMPIFFDSAVFIACMSHNMDNTGKQIEAPRASNFHLKLSSVFSHSFVAKRDLGRLIDRAWPRHVSHRWGSLEEGFAFLNENFVEIEHFVRTFNNSDGRRNKTCLQLQKQYLDNLHERRLLLVEIALYNDVLKLLKEACLYLEGDYALAHKAYGIIQKVATGLRLDDLMACPLLPNVEALLRGNEKEGVQGAHQAAALRRHVMDCLHDIRLYGTQQFYGDGEAIKFRKELDLFKAARIIDHSFVRQQQRDDINPEVLSIFPFISDHEISNLIGELPQYLNAASLARSTYPVRSFWVDNRTALPSWYAVVEKLWLVQPSSAMMERVFSVLNNVFGKQQTTVLNDVVEATVMVRFNHTDRTKGAAAQAAALVEEEI